ncbi:MAG: redoxin domain-containing protein [Dehalococcoidia bacterium]
MLEDDSTERRNLQQAKNSAVEPEKTAEKTRKRRRRQSTKRQRLIPPGRWPTISIGAIILCLGLVGFSIFMLTRDITPIVIQKLSLSDMTESSVIITWQTNEPATSEVTICNSDNCTSAKPDESLVTNHSATLTDINPNIRYQITVMSRDKRGNEARLAIELIAPPKVYTTPLAISGIKIVHIADSSIVLGWQTNRPATSQVEYGENDTNSLSTPLDKELTTNHRISLTELRPSTTYHFKVKSEDVGKIGATSETQTFLTLSVEAAAVEVGPEIGERAPDFTLLTIYGKEISLSQFHGKTVMVNFWETTCPACAEETPYIQAVFNGWPSNNLEILAVSVGERAAFVQSFLDSRGLTFPALLDSDEAVSNTYQVTSFPTTFFINADGIIKEIKAGRFTSQFEIEIMLKSL